jgi:osmotically-inducible protein OsmY
MPQRAMTFTQFCKAYAIGETMARQAIKDGKLKANKLSARKVLIRVEDAEAFVTGKIAA